MNLFSWLISVLCLVWGGMIVGAALLGWAVRPECQAPKHEDALERIEAELVAELRKSGRLLVPARLNGKNRRDRKDRVIRRMFRLNSAVVRRMA